MSTPVVVRLVFWLWLIGALAAGRSGFLTRLPLPAVQAILFGLTALLALAYRVVAPFRTWIDSLDLRGLVLLHVTRLVGLYFLLLYQRGELPYAFAVPGGIGDVLVAVFAILILVLPLDENRRMRMISIWNVVGLVDILLVVVTAARLGLSGSQELRALTFLPLSLLPTFLVPLIIASHLVIFARVRRAKPIA